MDRRVSICTGVSEDFRFLDFLGFSLEDVFCSPAAVLFGVVALTTVEVIFWVVAVIVDGMSQTGEHCSVSIKDETGSVADEVATGGSERELFDLWVSSESDAEEVFVELDVEDGAVIDVKEGTKEFDEFEEVVDF